MSVCAVCGQKVPNMGAKIIRGKSGEWVCKECLKKADVGSMKFSSTHITADEIKCLINGTEYECNFSPKGYNPPYYKKRKGGKGGLFILILIIFFIFGMTMGAIFDEEEPQDNTTLTSKQESTQSYEKEEIKNNLYETEKDLITFEGIEAKFIKLYDPKAGVTAFAVALNLNNTSDKEYTVTLSDGYVNNTKVQFMTGLPVTVAPGKKTVGVYMFGYDGLGFSKIEEIKKMEFKLSLINENWDGMKTSKTIELNF